MSAVNPTGNLPLFDCPPERQSGPDPRARTSDPDTSHSAAASMADGGAETQRRAILLSLRADGPTTADGLDARLDLRVTSSGRRLSELGEAGLVEMTERKALTRSGRSARVWQLTLIGKEVTRER